MKKNILFIALLSFVSVLSFAQDEATDTTEVVAEATDYPVFGTFESGSLIDAQTVVIPEVKTLEMVIQHKFGTIEEGRSNLWGIYGSANIRLALNYVPYKNVQIGAGITKINMTTDLNAKWKILEQTAGNKMPVSVALYGVVGIDGRNKSDFADSVSVGSPIGDVNEFGFSDRLSYFSQVIVGRKFNDWLSLQAGASFSHYNLTNYQAPNRPYDHDRIGAHLNGRVKVTTQGSIIFSYDAPLKIKGISEMDDFDNATHPEPTLSFGYEISTGTHAFQIYMANTSSLVPQENMMWNQNTMDNKGFAIGFTMTRLWAY